MQKIEFIKLSNTTMTQTYFQIGKRIVEEEQGGETKGRIWKMHY